VTRWLAEHHEQIRVFLLPSYNPELNPDELLNQDVKTNALGRVRPINVQEMMVAISNHRILDIDGDEVKFTWRDYRDNNQQKTMTLTADQFIGRFLLHVLPNGFHRIRYNGLLPPGSY
jgi:hypothetical protein